MRANAITDDHGTADGFAGSGVKDVPTTPPNERDAKGDPVEGFTFKGTQDRGLWTFSVDTWGNEHSIAYAVGDVVQNPGGTFYECTVAHDSSASTEPGVGQDWATVWQAA
jgi:hypothetical protein